jgi:hypothetical protein
MRRRLRAVRAARDRSMLELGALVFEMHRRDRHDARLVQSGVERVAGWDAEERALSAALGEAEPVAVSSPAPGECVACGVPLHTGARFCAACGAPAGPVAGGSHPVAAGSVTTTASVPGATVPSASPGNGDAGARARQAPDAPAGPSGAAPPADLAVER